MKTIKKYLYKFAFHNSNILCISDLLRYDVFEVFKGTPYVVNNGIKVENFESINYSKTIKL